MSETADRPQFGLDDPDMQEMKKVAAEQGKGGDLEAIKLSWQMREGARGVTGLPPINDLPTLQTVQGQLIALFDAGLIADRRALTYARLIEYRRRTIVTIDHELRIEAIEDEEDDDETPPAVRL